MPATEYPILDDYADPAVDCPFRVQLNLGALSPLLVAVPSANNGCEGCFAYGTNDGTCNQLPICDDQFRSDGEDCIFILYTGGTDHAA